MSDRLRHKHTGEIYLLNDIEYINLWYTIYILIKESDKSQVFWTCDISEYEEIKEN